MNEDVFAKAKQEADLYDKDNLFQTPKGVCERFQHWILRLPYGYSQRVD